jgi:hypothetical protein
MRKVAASALVAAALVGMSATPAPQKLRLLQRSDLTYVGAFALPASSVDRTSFSYGGTSLAYNPARNSLFLVGHDWYQQTAEVSIPPALKRPAPGALRRAAFIQPFADGSAGSTVPTGQDGNKVGGLLVYGGRLYGTTYVYYDAAGKQVVSHWVRPTTSLTGGEATGLYRVGGLGAGFVSGYMTVIPPAWAGRFGGPALTGNCCLSIISRTSYGPALFTFDPAAVGVASPVPATPLVYYPSTHPTIGNWSDSWNPARGIFFNGATTIRDVVFPAGSRSVLFFGTQGTGPFCYGEGTSDKSLAGTKAPDGADYCYDPDGSSKGTHAYPYVSEVWAYDANDLLAVRGGRKRPWAVRPYAAWRLTLPFGASGIGGAAYDLRSGRIYVSQQYGNGTDPVIHVFRIR